MKNEMRNPAEVPFHVLHNGVLYIKKLLKPFNRTKEWSLKIIFSSDFGNSSGIQTLIKRWSAENMNFVCRPTTTCLTTTGMKFSGIFFSGRVDENKTN